MSMKTVRRMAAGILGVGQSKIRIRPDASLKVAEALTRDDVRGMIDEGSIGFVVPRGVSRIRAKIKHIQKKGGRRRGIGSRKGSKYSKISAKRQWIALVRSQRNLLARLAGDGSVAHENFRKIYLMVKGRAFKSKANMVTYLKDNGLLAKKEKT